MRPIVLLELLIETRPRALTKEEIHRSLWADTFVSDATLTSLVAELRAAIGEEARTPLLVRTIHGYGRATLASRTLSNRAICRRTVPPYRPVQRMNTSSGTRNDRANRDLR